MAPLDDCSVAAAPVGYVQRVSEQYDCVACGACCYGQRDYVQVFAHDADVLGPEKMAEFVAPAVSATEASVGRPSEPNRFLKMVDGHCKALNLSVPGKFTCNVYENRPTLCRALTPGTTPCLEARARRGVGTRAVS